MRAVMDVGGTCASGQTPYVIRQQCPQGGDWILPLSIFVGLAATLVFVAVSPKSIRGYVILAWTGLFVALGWNFLDASFPWNTAQNSIIAFILGVFFVVMGLAPLVPLIRRHGRPTQDYSADYSPVHIEYQSPSSFTTQLTNNDAPGVVEGLSKISAMHAAGELTDDEFEKIKKQLLGESE